MIVFAGPLNHGLRVQRLNGEGVAAWQSGSVLISATAIPVNGFAAAGDGAGGVLVSWKEFNAYSGGVESTFVHVQRIDTTGALLWGEHGSVVSASARGNGASMIMTGDGYNGALVVWWGNENEHDFIRGQHVTGSGVPAWGQNGKTIVLDTGYVTPTHIIPDGSGGGVFAWRKIIAGGINSYDFYLQHVDSSGVATWAAEGLHPDTVTTQIKLLDALVPDGNEGAIAVYSYRRAPSAGVFVQHIGSNGVSLWDPLHFPVFAYGVSWYELNAVEDRAHGAIVVRSGLDSAGETHYYSGRVRPDGTMDWVTLVSDIGTAQTTFSALPTADGGVAIAWEEDLSDTNADIFIQYLDHAGAKRWPDHGLPVTTAPNLREGPHLALTGSNDAIITWEVDQRWGIDSNAAYAQRILFSTVAGVAPSSAPEEFRLAQNFPNPFNPSTDIRYDLPHGTHVRLTVFDLLGRKVATLVDAHEEAGPKSVRFDAGSVPSGIYFYRLEAGTFTGNKKMLLLR